MREATRDASASPPRGVFAVDEHAAFQLADVRFGYGREASRREILSIHELCVDRGSFVFLFGPSGSGKTTLLGLLAGVLKTRSGTLMVLGRDLAHLSSSERDAFRGAHIGYIFQLFNLIPYLTVLENISLSSARRRRLQGVSVEQAARRAAERLGIDGILDHPVTELSVGQQQRVAAARALIGSPEIVLADEPTSSLDADLRERFLELLFSSCRESGATLVFVSHDRTLASLFDLAISLPAINRAGA